MNDLTDEQRARALEMYNTWAKPHGIGRADSMPTEVARGWLAVEAHVLASHTCPDVEADERVRAWHDIAAHPFFAACYQTEGTLVDAMVAKLDAAHECSAVPVERLSAAVRRVRELHRESNGSLSALYPNPICECGKDYPCQTARALAEDPK